MKKRAERNENLQKCRKRDKKGVKRAKKGTFWPKIEAFFSR